MRFPNQWIGRDGPRPYTPQSQNLSTFFFFPVGVYKKISFVIENPRSASFACNGSPSGNASTSNARNWEWPRQLQGYKRRLYWDLQRHYENRMSWRAYSNKHYLHTSVLIKAVTSRSTSILFDGPVLVVSTNHEVPRCALFLQSPAPSSLFGSNISSEYSSRTPSAYFFSLTVREQFSHPSTGKIIVL
jgi:hypothetical protein